MTRLNERLSQNPLIIFLIVLVIPIAGTLFSELVMFDLPGGEVQQLVAFMTMTGLMSSLLSFAFYRLGILEWFRSLRWAIWMVIALLVLMIFLNVWGDRALHLHPGSLSHTDVGLAGIRGFVGADHRLLRVQNHDRPLEQAA